MRDPEVRHREAMAGVQTVFHDHGVEDVALPVCIGSLIIAGEVNPSGLILNLVGADQPVTIVPLFLRKEELFKIEAVLREARLQFPGCFQ